MSIEVSPQDTFDLPATFSETSLALPEDLSYPDWERLGHVLQRMERSVMWWVGDWLRFGERKYGETYAQAIEATGKSYSTLANAAYVCGQVESSRRRENLSWSHHSEIAALDSSEQDDWLAKAEANDWTRQEFRHALRRRPPPKSLVPPPGTFATIVVDPPWQYSNKATRGAAEDHYRTMSLDELAELAIPAATDSHLYLWTTNGFLREAFHLIEVWGFAYKTALTWCKPQIGLGNYFRNSTEHILFAVKGSLPTNGDDTGTWFTAKRKKHSSKPPRFYEIVEKVSPGPYLDMFARRSDPEMLPQRKGDWTLWGDEA